MELSYNITHKDNKPCVYLYDPPQRLEASEVLQWINEIRDEQPDLSALLTRIYMRLTKGNYTKSDDNQVILQWRQNEQRRPCRRD